MTDELNTLVILGLQCLLFVGYHFFTDYSNEASGVVEGVSNDIYWIRVFNDISKEI